MNNNSKIIVSLFGIGFIPFAPGTIGSFFSILFYYLTINLLSLSNKIIIFIVIFLLSLWAIDNYSKYKKSHDSSEIIIDEFLGISFIFLFYDIIKFSNDILTVLVIFILFRFFDISKIFPANFVDKNIKNSLGVILDDIIASLYCVIILVILNFF